LQYGIDNGYCSNVVCFTHDSVPMTVEEEDEFGEGGDPCVAVVRPYHDEIERRAVEREEGSTFS
jgi:hypothetical protein